MTDICFKNLSLDNWMEPDPLLRGFARMEPDGSTRSLTANDWASRLLEPQLGELVPIEVRGLFEVAQGAMLYGYFFYPLYTLSSEQLYRVAEAAIRHKFATMKGPKQMKTFKKRLEWLLNKGAIPLQESASWDAIRKLRNIASHSHPTRQKFYLPTMAVASLQDVAQKINYIFRNV